MADLEDDEYEVPLRDQRYFGTGIKRKRIQFVPSNSNTASIRSSPATPSSAAERYLSIVLDQTKQSQRSVSVPPTRTSHDASDKSSSESPDQMASEVPNDAQLQPTEKPICDICHRVIVTSDNIAAHESSIAHQICLQHSHPPSHIDRSRKGLAVLESQGWDPDSRLGLGAGGEGRLHPVKATENPERAGLGAKLRDAKVKDKPVRLDAGKVRMAEREGKKKAERLRNAFYRSEEVEKYLGQEQINPGVDLKAFQKAKRGR